jgi:hypothetical protein
MVYDKMNEYIETIFQVYFTAVKMTNNSKVKYDYEKLKCISMLIYKYVIKLAKDNEFNITNINQNPDTNINLVPFFEYITHKNIELFDFGKIKESDIDVSSSDDIERFVLSHIYYLTQ